MDNDLEILNEYMANLKVLNNNLYNMHFNVVGESFFGLHKKLEEYYNKVAIMYDNIAETIKIMKGFPITSLNKIEDISSIKSMISQNYNGKQILSILDNDFNFLVDYTKDLIEYFNKNNNYYVVNILNDNLIFFEKELWMIKSSLI